MTDKKYLSDNPVDLYKLIMNNAIIDIEKNSAVLEKARSQVESLMKLESQFKLKIYEQFKQNHLGLSIQDQMVCALKQSLNLFQQLEKDKPDACKTCDYNELIILTCKQNNLEAFKYLSSKITNNQTLEVCIYLCILHDRYEIFQYLMENINKDISLVYNYLPFACYLGFVDIIEYMLLHNRKSMNNPNNTYDLISMEIIEKSIIYICQSDQLEVYKLFKKYDVIKLLMIYNDYEKRDKSSNRNVKHMCYGNFRQFIEYHLFANTSVQIITYLSIDKRKFYGADDYYRNDIPDYRYYLTKMSYLLCECKTLDKAKKLVLILGDFKKYCLSLMEWIIQCKRDNNKELENYLTDLI